MRPDNKGKEKGVAKKAAPEQPKKKVEKEPMSRRKSTRSSRDTAFEDEVDAEHRNAKA